MKQCLPIHLAGAAIEVRPARFHVLAIFDRAFDLLDERVKNALAIEQPAAAQIEGFEAQDVEGVIHQAVIAALLRQGTFERLKSDPPSSVGRITSPSITAWCALISVAERMMLRKRADSHVSGV